MGSGVGRGENGRGSGMGGSTPMSSGDPLDGLLDSLFGPSELSGRRLQFGAEPEEDIWMIGGVFLEHFVTIFDFDKAQIGFAEPAGGVHALTPSSLSALPATRAGILTTSTGSRHGALALAACVGSATIAGVALLGSVFQRLARGASSGEVQSMELGNLIETIDEESG